MEYLGYIIALVLLGTFLVVYSIKHRKEIYETNEEFKVFETNLESFFGKRFYKILDVTIRAVTILGVLGSIAAYYTGIVKSVDIFSVGRLISYLFIIAFAIACIYRAIEYAIKKKFWVSIYEVVKLIILIIVVIALAIIALLIFGFIFNLLFGKCDVNYDLDHVHFERF